MAVMRMRCLVTTLTVCAAVAAPVPAAAQRIGAKAGVTFSDIALEDLELNTQPEAGALAGAFVGVGLTPRISLQVEALFAQRRVRFEETFREDVNYLEVPVLGRVRVLTVRNSRVNAVGGAALAFRLDARLKFSGESEDISHIVEPFDLAAAVGADVEVGRRLVFDFRYLHSLSDRYTAPDVTAKYRTIQVTAGYRFK